MIPLASILAVLAANQEYADVTLFADAVDFTNAPPCRVRANVGAGTLTIDRVVEAFDEAKIQKAVKRSREEREGSTIVDHAWLLTRRDGTSEMVFFDERDCSVHIFSGDPGATAWDLIDGRAGAVNPPDETDHDSW